MDFMDQHTKNTANDYWICIPVHSGRSNTIQFYYHVPQSKEQTRKCKILSGDDNLCNKILNCFLNKKFTWGVINLRSKVTGRPDRLPA